MCERMSELDFLIAYEKVKGDGKYFQLYLTSDGTGALINEDGEEEIAWDNQEEYENLCDELV